MTIIAGVCARRQRFCGPGRAGHFRLLAALCLGAGLSLATSNQPAAAQAQAVVVDDESPATDTAPKQPFVLPAAKSESLEALQDFRRAVAKGTWEAAFKQLDKLAADTSTDW